MAAVPIATSWLLRQGRAGAPLSSDEAPPSRSPSPPVERAPAAPPPRQIASLYTNFKCVPAHRSHSAIFIVTESSAASPEDPRRTTRRTHGLGGDHPGGYALIELRTRSSATSCTTHDHYTGTRSSIAVVVRAPLNPSTSRRNAARPTSRSAQCSAHCGGRDTPRERGYRGPYSPAESPVPWRRRCGWMS
jgi:hypothetical protein